MRTENRKLATLPFLFSALLWFVFLFVTIFSAIRTAEAQSDICPDNVLPPRLIVGEIGRVLPDNSVNIRPDAGTQRERVGFAPPGTSFEVSDGPTCAEGFTWWQVSYTDPDDELITGWMAEGDPASGDYWLEPRGQRVVIEDEEGNPVNYVIDAEGRLEREGCMPPPDDYIRVELGYATLTTRTLAMLDQAQRLYDEARAGIVNFRSAVTQGSYNPGGEAASFGTHDGGGAVDISVRSPLDFSILSDDIDPMIDAMRVAGFAAWLREPDLFYPGSPIHIHAIAVGDAELSPAARDQIDGEFGYLRGYDGLPPEYGGPRLDNHGGPIICWWMEDMGFGDLRPVPESTPEATITP